ncbi:ABC-three component system middle component 6 [Gluconobacter kondonii]|uniref:ABC-three component system middle component 6 n=1 Tax=Gluconobacter kondonii TaxID=941463 RepID=UPI001B8B2B60|nr:ABC-three component system middle component 6 [Gluconobacter kondonii]MBS1053703.1 hypothetical protein [Gluconobacter kondonii]
MILPTKHIPASRSLAAIGGEILAQIEEPRAVSEIWERVLAARCATGQGAPLPYDWFVLALTFLNSIFAVELSEGLVVRTEGRQ